MRQGIRRYGLHFVAVLGVMALGIGVGGVILDQQRLRFPLIEEKPFEVEVELEHAGSVAPGQGQFVVVAGVKVGDIAGVRLEEGRAVVTLEIQPRFRRLVRSSSTALLRPKTALKDMFVELHPGRGAPLREGARIPLVNTAVSEEVDELLPAVDTDVLDRDVRSYLKMIVASGGKAAAGRGGDLRRALRRLGPTHAHAAQVNGALARRRRNLRRLVNRYGLLVRELGRADRDVVRLVRAGNATLSAVASEGHNLSRAVAELPRSLDATRGALARVDVLARRLRPTLRSLEPAARSLEPAARELEPLAREATPILRRQLRPFVRVAAPELIDLGVAARRLARAGPQLTRGTTRLNRLLNLLAYNPGGAEGLAGKSHAEQRARRESYLYWFAWTAQNTITLFGTADDQGVFRRITLGGASCSVLTAGGLPPALADLLGDAGLCQAVSP